MTTTDDMTPVHVFSGSAWEAGMVKSLLENAGILTFMRDEIRGTYAPWHVAAGGAGPVKLVVSMADSDKAREVVEQFYNSRG